MALDFVSYEGNKVWEEMMKKIFRIEQDMWARWIGEYVRCTCCGKIYSKSDVYGREEFWKISRETVSKIEEICGGIPLSHCCHAPQEHIYGFDTYIESIRNRYKRASSLITMAQTEAWEVVWFLDGYVAPLEEVYIEEFSDHFKSEVIDEISKKSGISPKQKILTCASLGTDDKNKSIWVTLQLLDIFFQEVSNDMYSLDSVVESILHSTTYEIFSLMWAQRLNISNTNRKTSHNTCFSTDVLFQKNVWDVYKKWIQYVWQRDVVSFLKRSL